VVSVVEDTPYQFATSDFQYTDAELHSLQSIVLVSLPSNGSLLLEGVPVSANQVIDAIDIASLQYIPKATVNGVAGDTISFYITDNGGVANGGVNTSITTAQMQIDIISVNDAPVGADSSISLLEDTIYTLTATDFGFSDVEDSNNFQAVRIINTPTAGQLSLSGLAVSSGQTIPITDTS